jgi:hypothetical protein
VANNLVLVFVTSSSCLDMISEFTLGDGTKIPFVLLSGG